jgi:hypothetical protein
VNGPVKAATIRNGKGLRATGRGMGLGHTLAANPDPASAVLETGTKRYCLTLGTATAVAPTFRVDKVYTGRNAAAPGACPP